MNTHRKRNNIYKPSYGKMKNYSVGDRLMGGGPERKFP
jgi:hypothetical protein